MKKLLLILLVSAILPVQAGQFKVWQGYVINRNAVTHVEPYGEKAIRVFYPASASNFTETGFSNLRYSNQIERNQKLNEMIKWLNEKD